MRSVAPVRRSLLAAAGSLLLLAGLLPAAAVPVLAVSPDVVISEVYGGGGNSDATLRNDFIELYNRGGAAVDLSAWSVQYASSAGSTWQVTPLTGSIAAGGYYLVQEAAGAGGSASLPTPDATGSIPMSATSGKVALVTNATALTVACGANCDSAPGVRDYVGYGAAATDFEGAGPTATLSNTTSAIRAGGGATDTDNNAADFAVGGPDPDNSGVDTAPAVATTSPANGATGVAVNAPVSVTFSELVTLDPDAIAFSCTPSGPAASVDSGPATTFTLLLGGSLPAGATCSIHVDGSKVHDADTADPPDVMAGTFTASFAVASPVDPCTQPFTPISSIQGSGDSAAITGTVTTQGVVVGDNEGPAPELRGFYLQDPAGDGNALTSDGIFVFNGNANSVALGDIVRVSGTAADFQEQTQITASSIRDCGDGTVAPTAITLPLALADRERYEGMLVRLTQELVVNETFQLGRFGQVTLGSERHFSPTLVAEPGAAALAEIERQRADSLIVDDELQNQNRDPILFGRLGNPLSAENTLRIGDTVTGLTGVMTFTWAGNAASGNAYRVRPIDALGGGVPPFQPSNARPEEPEPIDGELRVAAMNVLNYFTTLDPRGTGPFTCGPLANLECRGANDTQEFERQQAKIVAAITGLDAHIVGLNELENNATQSLESIVAALNAADGAGTWAYIDTGTIGTDAIKIGIIYKPAAVTPVGSEAILTTAVDPRFVDTRSRPALAQTFDQASGGRLTVVVNHLKSKGSGCGAGDDATDGSGNCNGTRTQAAEALVDWIATDPTGSGDRDVLVIGDLNSYAREAPIDVFLREGYTNMVEQFMGGEAYSFVFDASSGYLDHALASPTLAAQVEGVTEWHINADEPNVLDYNTDFKSADQIESLYEPDQYRSADHDPLIVGLDLLDYEFDGFRPPVDNPPDVNEAKSGAVVPVKFDLADGLGLDALFTTPTSRELTCSTGAPTDDVETTASADGSGLQQDPLTGQYTYEWKSSKGWSGECRDFEITFDDGTYRRALFAFTR